MSHGEQGRPSADTSSEVLRPEEIDAVIFDMDGVLTDTATAHFRAWREALDEFLRARSEEEGIPFEPFTRNDFRRHVDGKARYEGARDFLRARGIDLPFGEPDDPPGAETVCALGNRKDERYRQVLREEGLDTFAGAVTLVRRLRESGVRTAVVTSSRNGRPVLESAGIAGGFDVIIDGTDLAEASSLTGKPAPDLFLEAARRLDAKADRTVVVEDSAAGVEAGRRGEFGLVIGVARERDRGRLESAGADLVVADLAQVPISSGLGKQASRDRPDAEGDADPGGG